MSGKWGRRLFTIGGIFLILMGLVHSLSLFENPAPANETERQLDNLMSSYQFNLMGTMRTMDSLLRGFSISFMLAAILFGALDLILCRERTDLLKRIALVNVIWLAAMTAVSLHYFFALPTSFMGVALILFAAAWIALPAQRLS